MIQEERTFVNGYLEKNLNKRISNPRLDILAWSCLLWFNLLELIPPSSGIPLHGKAEHGEMDGAAAETKGSRVGQNE